MAALTQPTNGTLSDVSHVNQYAALYQGGLINDAMHGYNAVGGGSVDDTTPIQNALAAGAASSRGARTVLPPGLYKVSGTLSVGRSQTLEGSGWDSTVLLPTAMTVPVVDLTGLAGGEGPSIVGISINNGGTAGIPAIQAPSVLSPRIEHCRVDTWAGKGIDLALSVHSVVRDTRVVSCVGDGITGHPTIGLFENVQSSNGGGNGFVLDGGAGSLIGCSSDANTGHGYLITGGEWFLQIYGETNGGDVLHVDGSLFWSSSVTLNAVAALNATTLTVVALTKPLPRGAILRFADGTTTYTSSTSGIGYTTVNITAPLSAGQSNGAVATLAPDDLPLGSLPSIWIGPSVLDGHISLHACRYAFVGGFVPTGSSLSATTSAYMMGESFVLSRGVPNTAGSTLGGGGSLALAGMLGSPDAVMAVSLAHVSSPLAEFQLQPAAATTEGTPRTIFNRLDVQWAYVQTAITWTVQALPVGQYTIRARVRDAGQTAGNVQLQTPAGTTNFTTKTTGWEWIQVEYDHTAAFRAGGGDFKVQRQTATSNVDVDSIVIVPRALTLSTTGTVKTGRSTTANRPSPIAEGAGARWYDTTLSKPVWSDGTVWRDAAGTAV